MQNLLLETFIKRLTGNVKNLGLTGNFFYAFYTFLKNSSKMKGMLEMFSNIHQEMFTQLLLPLFCKCLL